MSEHRASEEQILELIAPLFGSQELTVAEAEEALRAADSLTIVEIISCLEDEFDVIVNIESLRNASRTVTSLCALVADAEPVTF
jgi:acyl carrier protein